MLHSIFLIFCALIAWRFCLGLKFGLAVFVQFKVIFLEVSRIVAKEVLLNVLGSSVNTVQATAVTT